MNQPNRAVSAFWSSCGSEVPGQAFKDLAQWMPPAGGYHCQYTAESVATKLRRSLAADDAEHGTPLGPAEHCPSTTVACQPAP